MKSAAVLIAAAAVLVGCSQDNASPQPQDSQTIAVSPEPTEPSVITSPTAVPTTTAAPSPTATKTKKSQPGADAFCTYLEQTQGAQQQIEDPAQFVELVEGAAAVAPGAIAEDAALYVESVRALATALSACWLAVNTALKAVTAGSGRLDCTSTRDTSIPSPCPVAAN